MEALFICLVGFVLLILIFKYFSKQVSPFKLRPPFRQGLPKDPTRGELIAHAETFWTGQQVPLKGHGSITACAGRSTFVHRDQHGQARIICYRCARALVRQVYADTKGTWQTSAGPVSGISARDFAHMRLQTMWFYTNHFYIVTYRGGIQAVSEQLTDFHPCVQSHCS